MTSAPVAHTRALVRNNNVTLSVASPESKEPKDGGPKLSALDAFSLGANKGGNVANTIIGAYNGAIAGAVTGGAIALGTSVISAAAGALTGSNPIGWGTLLSTVTSTGLWAAGGATIGAVGGGILLNKTGDVFGNLGAKVARKAGGNENLGRAIGTVGTGVALGTIVGASVLGWNGAVIALGAGAVGGGLAYLNN
jgi:hypothetical protein